MTPELTDAEAIQASRRRPELFEHVFNRHYSAVFRFAAGRMGADEAADVASDTFARAFDRRQRFDTGRASALPWLFGIAANVMRERRRKATRKARAMMRFSAGEHHAHFEGETVDRLDATGQAHRLRRALAGLSDDEYQVLMLAALADLSYQEIADTLEVPIGTVRSRLSRARRRMREQLEADRPISGGSNVGQRVL